MSVYSLHDVFKGSSRMAIDGLWSGSENRDHQHFIAMIPESRYVGDQNGSFNDWLPSEAVHRLLRKKKRPHRSFVEPAYNRAFQSWLERQKEIEAELFNDGSPPALSNDEFYARLHERLDIIEKQIEKGETKMNETPQPKPEPQPPPPPTNGDDD